MPIELHDITSGCCYMLAVRTGPQTWSYARLYMALGDDTVVMHATAFSWCAFKHHPSTANMSESLKAKLWSVPTVGNVLPPFVCHYTANPGAAL